MSITRRVKRALALTATGALALSLMPAGAAVADIDDVCENAPDSGFTDKGTTHADNIDCLFAYEITSGQTATTFGTFNPLTRGQAAQLFVNFAVTATNGAIADEVDEDIDVPFTDIDGTTFEAAIETIYRLGLISGTTATTYTPNANITREQFATILFNAHEAFGVEFDDDYDDAFNDDDNSVHEDNINALAGEGIISGTTATTFSPMDNVTRGQTASLLMESAGLLDDLGLWLAPRLQAPGPGTVTLDVTSTQAGGTITGSVDDPGTLQSVSVTGCGFTNATVNIENDGDFELTIPAGQTAGACALTFNVLRTDGSSTQQTINFNVTSAPQQTTAAPDLVSASRSGAFVTYTFNTNVSGTAPAASNFAIYSAGGTRTEPTEVSVPANAPTTVIARYASSDTAGNATVATVREGAVTDAQGRSNYPDSAALGAQARAAGLTDAPDLQTVNNARVQAGLIVADFRFDEAVDNLVVGDGAGGFFLIDSDGEYYTGLEVRAVSADSRTISVSFSATEDIPIGNVVRGGVDGGTVEDDDGNFNVTQTEPRSGTPGFTTGVTANRTDRPDITGVAVAGTNVVAITFDQAVTTTINAGNISVYNSDGDETVATVTGTERSSTNTTIVNVTFPVGAVGSAVGVIVEDAAVTAVSNNLPNRVQEIGLQAVSFTAGRTSLPDLVRVNITFDALGDPTVIYTFDQDLELADVADGQFFLVDANGQRFLNPGPVTLGADDNQVRFRIQNANAFTRAQAAAAVRGAVQDPLPVDFPEGSVTVTR